MHIELRYQIISEYNTQHKHILSTNHQKNHMRPPNCLLPDQSIQLTLDGAAQMVIVGVVITIIAADAVLVVTSGRGWPA